MTPNRQAARIVADFEDWARGENFSGSNPYHVGRLVGAKEFARQMIVKLPIHESQWKLYRDQLDAIRDRVLPPVELENRS